MEGSSNYTSHFFIFPKGLFSQTPNTLELQMILHGEGREHIPTPPLLLINHIAIFCLVFIPEIWIEYNRLNPFF